jgi:streptogramin lyase
VDTAGRIFVTDDFNARVVMMDDMAGKNWKTFGTKSFDKNGNYITGQGQFAMPFGIWVDAQGRIYIADPHCCIVRIDDMKGLNWTIFGSKESKNPALTGPHGICLDFAERIYVACVGYNCIVRMDDMKGTNLVAFGSKGDGEGQFNYPIAVFVDLKGMIYIVDNGNCRIVRMENMQGAGWTAFGSPGRGTGQFRSPAGIHVDAKGRIYVADQGNDRIVRIDDMTGSNWLDY